MVTYPGRTLAILVVVAACVSLPLISAEKKTEKREVKVDDIGDSVTLIGRLGKPLGKKMTIRGKWVVPKKAAKGPLLRYLVTEVDGKKLDKPEEFNVEQMFVRTIEDNNAIPNHNNYELDGEEWKMNAYETGRIHIQSDLTPDDSPIKLDGGVSYYLKPFTSELVCVVTERPEQKK